MITARSLVNIHHHTYLQFLFLLMRTFKITDTGNSMVVTRGKGVGTSGVKGHKYMVTEGNLTLNGGHTMQYTDHVP